MKMIDCSGKVLIYFSNETLNILKIKKLDSKYMQSLLAERKVFEIVSGDYVVKSFYSFTYDSYLVFILEYMMGGDFVALIRLFVCFEEWIVK